MSANLQVLSNKEDVLIAVMGVTGSGKSSFIKSVTGIEEIKVGHGLCSETDEVQSYTTIIDEKTVVLVDTPGFDDTFESDEIVVERIADWLSLTYQSNRLLNGILYLHRIDAPRLGGSSSRSLRMLKEICGQDAYKNIVLATTFWDKEGESEGAAKEKELLEEDTFWKKLIAEGARSIRMPGDAEARKNLLQDMGAKTEAVLKIQKEMVEEGKAFEETTAATEIDHALTKLKLEQTETLRKAQAHAELQVAIAEADRIFGEEEARAIHNLRLEEHERRVAYERQLEERRAKERLAAIARQQEQVLREKRLEALRQERELNALVQAEIEATRRKAVEIKETETATRRNRCLAQEEAINNQAEFWKSGCSAGLVQINARSHSALLRFCDNCLMPIGSSTYYACTECSPNAFIVCMACFGAQLYCRNDSHTLARRHEAETLNRCYRAINPQSAAVLICDRCSKRIKALYFHCCTCDGDNFDMCLTCAMGGRQCRDAQHCLQIGLTPIFPLEISSGDSTS